jgi:PIN domain nuclease of toxin-antitoxin system
MEKNNYRKLILDASALIALIGKEKGWEAVQTIIPKAVMSSVNVAEVAQYFISKKGISSEHIELIVLQLIQDIIPFDGQQAFTTASLIIQTKQYGLSLADRACISLGLSTGYPIYTTDRAWASLAMDNLSINIIR